MAVAGASYVHTVIECAKLAFADREAFYGDPDFVDVPLDAAAVGRVRRRAARRSSATRRRPSCGPGGGRLPRRRSPAPRAELAGRGRADARRHLPPRRRRPPRQRRLRDAERRLAAQLAGRPRPRLPARHARADVLARPTGIPNALEPGKRPRTTLSPTLALRDGEPYIAFGTPGGDQQDQWTLHVLPAPRRLRARPAGGDRRARVPHEPLPELVLPARGAPERARDRGAARRRRRSPSCASAATTSKVAGDWSLGRVSAAAREPDGLLKAAANPRGMQGYAVGR